MWILAAISWKLPFALHFTSSVFRKDTKPALWSTRPNSALSHQLCWRTKCRWCLSVSQHQLLPSDCLSVLPEMQLMHFYGIYKTSTKGMMKKTCKMTGETLDILTPSVWLTASFVSVLISRHWFYIYFIEWCPNMPSNTLKWRHSNRFQHSKALKSKQLVETGLLHNKATKTKCWNLEVPVPSLH